MRGSVGDSSPTSPQVTRKGIRRYKVDLAAYFSTSDKNREPTKENCDKEIDCPSGSIAMPIVGKDRFENEDVYVGIHSIMGC